MRIGFEAKRVFKNFTGLGNYSRAVVKILASAYLKDQFLLYTPLKDQKISQSLEHDFSNISIKEAPGKFFKSLWRISGITKDLRKDKIDLFHGLSNELPLNIKKARIPSVVTIHDLIFLRYPQYYKFIDRKIYGYKFRKACENADRIIAISQQTKDDIIEYFNIPSSKIAIVYQGCDPVFGILKDEVSLNNIKSKYQIPDNFLLCVGTIETRKNQLLIVKALAHISEDIHLVIVGRPTLYKKEIQDFLSLHPHLVKRVTFLEKVPFEDLPLIYQCASIFVYPSRIEGFGIPIVEALNSRIPVIAATGSCLEEAGGPNSLYIHPDDDIALAEAISRINSDNALREKMIAEGITYSKNFSDDAIATNLMNVYLKTLENA
jgi:glycosyltransferase involved in cell wall biosynthesis